MKRQSICVRVAILSLLGLAGCTGQIGAAGIGSGGTSGSGSGGTTGSGGTAVGSGTGGTVVTTGSGGATGTTGSGGTTGTTGSGGASMGVPGTLNLTGSPKYYRVIRLSNAQWAAAVQTVLNVPSGGMEQDFEGAVSGTTDFSNNELVLGLDSRNWQDYQSAAETLATQVTASASVLATVYSGTDPAGLITTVGRRAYRRPLTTAEQASYMTLYTQGSTQTGSGTAFTKGAYLVISAMLQSPNFLFRTELGAQGSPLNAYEMAAKLALWLRGTGPDDKTLDLAGGSGKLDTADGAATLATTMLGEAAASSMMRQFHGEWLHFDDYAQITKVDVPTYMDSLAPEYQESSYRFFDDIFTKGLGLKEMLLSTTGFYGPGMATLYGVTPPTSGYAQSDLGSKRVGFFSQLPYLTLNGINAEANSILRGVTLNLDVLCATLGPPAANIPPIPPIMPGQTNRQRIDTLTGTCGQ
ncbi:MAG TPA: DUF1592 domain-containing protein, partial [Polyangia bacterium]